MKRENSEEIIAPKSAVGLKRSIFGCLAHLERERGSFIQQGIILEGRKHCSHHHMALDINVVTQPTRVERVSRSQVKFCCRPLEYF